MRGQTRRTQQRGSSLVELSIVLLGFLMLSMGTMDFGWAVYAYNFCAYAAQDATRWASVHGSLSASPASIADVQTYVKNEAVGLTLANLTVTPCWAGDCASTAPAAGENAPGQTVSVTVSYNIQPLTYLGLKTAIKVSSTGQYVINH